MKMKKPKIRNPKSSDQEELEKAFQILRKTMQSHPEIENTLWAGAIMSCFVDGHINSEVSYEDFCESLDSIKKHYKKWFEDSSN